MRMSDVRSVAHSVADSIVGGMSFLTTFYDLNVYKDAAQSQDGVLTIDFLNGKVVQGTPSAYLSSAMPHIIEAFDRLSRAKGFGRSDWRTVMAEFHADPVMPGFTLIIEDSSGKVAKTDYEGVPARRALEIDPLGRVRRKATYHS
ncbi:hypothetical protein HOY34_08860 [Xinfangfangia sp. D13-10-4-6]|uniref:hypothetical protein n=1 Tax=Pseudogemmobacter hezensis TaxID=2737662 RepID=UPI001556D917|nr:hypothetical protein [Pseudogemmobacter hezensis]NPD15307.1 hypothetical protein [Pseudogemmobacter hezensis]